MDPHFIELPRVVLVGNGVIGKIPEITRELKLSGKPLILTGPTTKGIAGEKVQALFSNIRPDMEIVQEASYSEVGRIRDKISDIGFVIGVGGGKVIDTGKLFAFKEEIPFISVPTAPSHDGIASDRVSVKDKEFKYSLRAKPPAAIIADIGVLASAPYRLIASGCADIISNYTAVFDWKLGRKKGEYYSEYAAALSLLSAEIVLRSVDIIKEKQERGIRNLVEALVSSGISMSLVGSSRPSSGAEHMFSHVLDSMDSKALHGEQCGIGSIFTAFLQGQDWRRIRNSLFEIGAPVTAKDLGITEDQFAAAMLNANKIRKRYTILDEKDLDKNRIIDIARTTGIL